MLRQRFLARVARLRFLAVITGLLYVVTVISIFFAPRRRYWAEKLAKEDRRMGTGKRE